MSCFAKVPHSPHWRINTIHVLFILLFLFSIWLLFWLLEFSISMSSALNVCVWNATFPYTEIATSFLTLDLTHAQLDSCYHGLFSAGISVIVRSTTGSTIFTARDELKILSTVIIYRNHINHSDTEWTDWKGRESEREVVAAEAKRKGPHLKSKLGTRSHTHTTP